MNRFIISMHITVMVFVHLDIAILENEITSAILENVTGHRKTYKNLH